MAHGVAAHDGVRISARSMAAGRRMSPPRGRRLGLQLRDLGVQLRGAGGGGGQVRAVVCPRAPASPAVRFCCRPHTPPPLPSPPLILLTSTLAFSAASSCALVYAVCDSVKRAVTRVWCARYFLDTLPMHLTSFSAEAAGGGAVVSGVSGETWAVPREVIRCRGVEAGVRPARLACQLATQKRVDTGVKRHGREVQVRAAMVREVGWGSARPSAIARRVGTETTTGLRWWPPA